MCFLKDQERQTQPTIPTGLKINVADTAQENLSMILQLAAPACPALEYLRPRSSQQAVTSPPSPTRAVVAQSLPGSKGRHALQESTEIHLNVDEVGLYAVGTWTVHSSNNDTVSLCPEPHLSTYIRKPCERDLERTSGVNYIFAGLCSFHLSRVIHLGMPFMEQYSHHSISAESCVKDIDEHYAVLVLPDSGRLNIAGACTCAVRRVNNLF